MILEKVLGLVCIIHEGRAKKKEIPAFTWIHSKQRETQSVRVCRQEGFKPTGSNTVSWNCPHLDIGCYYFEKNDFNLKKLE